MKKILLILALVLSICVCFVSCGEDTGDNGGVQNGGNAEGGNGTEDNGDADDDFDISGEENEANESELYATLNSLVDKEYEKLSIFIIADIEDITLTARYVIESDNLTYSVEKMNYIDISSPSLPEDYKTTVSGTASISNGEIIKQNEDSVELPSYAELNGKFYFDKSNFENVKLEEGRFSAEVKRLSLLIGEEVLASNAEVLVVYDDDAVLSITITYETDGASVSTLYIFD